MSTIGSSPLRDLVEARRDEIKRIVEQHHGTSVALFGSVATGADRIDSDIDLLVELEPGARPIELLSIEVELEELLGVRVDVGTPGSLRDGLRDAALSEAIAL